MSGAQEPARAKDRWDKANIVGQVLVPIMLAILTTAYTLHEANQRKVESEQTRIMQQEQNEAAKASAVAEFLPFVRGDADSVQLAIVMAALLSLGYNDVAVRFAQLRPTEGAVKTLEVIATTADSASTRSSAVTALQHITNAPATPRDSGRTPVSSLAENALVRAQASETGQLREERAIVTGGFGRLEQALADAATAKSKGFAAEVYFRNRVYRTAIRVGSRAEARQKLSEIRSRVRTTAYLVDWVRWCPEPRQSRENHVVCAPSAPEMIVN